ncbi:MAG: hypothetical protein ACI9OU_000336 [Candidatus Promineifilaceae bacterium]|jgi:hypothetical protein
MKRSKTQRWLLASLVIAGFTLTETPCALGAGGHAVHFPETIRVNERTLTLSGTGVLSYRKFVKVYVAALYVDETAARFDVAAKRIEVEYLMGAKAKRLNAAGRRVLERSLSAEEIDGIADRLERFEALYPDGRDGERCSVTFIPQRGTLLHYDSVLLGEVPGHDFAQAYLNIWLGPTPADSNLRDQLRKGANARWPVEEDE